MAKNRIGELKVRQEQNIREQLKQKQLREVLICVTVENGSGRGSFNGIQLIQLRLGLEDE